MKKNKILIYPLVTLGLILVLFNSCKKDNNNNNLVTVLILGQSYQGGKIAYFLQQGDPSYDANVQHGLIAASSDQSTGIQWGNGSLIASDVEATEIGAGNENTNTIVSVQGAGNYAAKLCADLVLGGYSDWYLPSQDELSKLYLNKAAIGGFVNNIYWSSSWYGGSAQNVHCYNFSSGGGDTYSLYNNTHYVRAVRSF